MLGQVVRFWLFIKWVYSEYEMMASVSMLEPWEKYLWHSMVMAFFAMAVYTTYLYLPGHLLMWCRVISDLMAATPTEVT